MAYQGNQIDYNNLNNELKLKVDKAEGVERQLETLAPKANNSWQKGVFNDTDITNIGNTSISRSLRFTGWDADNSKLDSMYINLPFKNFSGIVKLTVTGDYQEGNSMGGAEVIYQIGKVGQVVHSYSKTIISISQQFANLFYIGECTYSPERMYIPITKSPNSRNPLCLKLEFVGESTIDNIFDAVKNITMATDPMISKPHPWTPQTSAIDSKFPQNTTRANNVDLNTYRTNGVYTLGDGLVNGVTPSHYGAYSTLYVSTSADVVTHLLIDYLGNTYTRSFGSGGWGTWKRLLTQDDYDQLFTSVSDGKTKVASAISDKGVYTSPVETFDNMANNIRLIQTGGGASGNGTTYMSGNNTVFSVSGLSFEPRVINIYSSSNGGRIVYNPMVHTLADIFIFNVNDTKWHNYGGTTVQVSPNGFVITVTAEGVTGAYRWEAFK